MASPWTSTSSSDDLRELVGTFTAIYEDETGRPFPQDPREQLRRAYRAVFDSWNAPRAQVYRRTYDIPDDLGTAVNVVQMVFGNRGERRGTGVCFTRDPATGESVLYGEFLAERAGRGRRRRDPDARADRRACASRCRRPSTSSSRRSTGSRRTTATCRTSSSRSRRATLYLLQTRTGKRTAEAALRDRGGDGRGGPHLARGGRRTHRPGPARPAPAPDDRPRTPSSRSPRRA